MNRDNTARDGGRRTTSQHNREFYQHIGSKGGQKTRALIEAGKRRCSQPDTSDPLPSATSGQSLRIRVKKHPSVNTIATVAVTGSIDHLTHKRLKGVIKNVLEYAGRHRLIIDLSSTSYLDSAGLSALVGGLQCAVRLNGILALVVSTGAISRIFAVTGLNRVFPIFENLTQAEIFLRHYHPETLLQTPQPSQKGATTNTAPTSLSVDKPINLLIIPREINDHTQLIQLIGEVTISTIEPLNTAILQAIRTGRTHIILNLQGVSLMTSVGFGSLLAAYKRLRPLNGQIAVIVDPLTQIPIMLRESRLDNVVTIYSGEAEALANAQSGLDSP